MPRFLRCTYPFDSPYLSALCTAFSWQFISPEKHFLSRLTVKCKKRNKTGEMRCSCNNPAVVGRKSGCQKMVNDDGCTMERLTDIKNHRRPAGLRVAFLQPTSAETAR
jgi:hypothetical protein